MAKRKLTESALAQFFEYNIDLKTRTLYYGANSSVAVNDTGSMEVNDWSAEQLIKGLYLLDQMNHKQINIVWNSHGGEWDAGISMYEFIRTLKSPVKMTSYSRCRSMGSVVLQSCKTRVLSENSRFMIHYGTDGTGEIHSKDFVKAAEESVRINEIMEDIYLKQIRKKHPRFTREKLKELMKYDYYMSAKEAVRLGLADKVI